MQPQTSPYNPIGIGETALSIGTGALAQPIASMYGVGSQMFGGDGKQAANRLAEALTYQPTTEYGQATSQAFGEFADKSGLSSLPPFLGLPAPRMGAGAAKFAAQEYGTPIAEKGLSMYEQGRLTPGMNPVSELNVYHGTPNQIKGDFSLDKVGSGEGAQAFGHGIYFAENPKVAEGYRKRLSGGTDPITYEYKGKQFLDPQMVEGRSFDPVGHAVRLTYHQGAPTARKVANEGLRASKAQEPYALEMGGTEYYQKMLDTAKSINRKDIKGTQGFLYKADIPDEQLPMMLNWDKPFSQQNPEIQALLKDKSSFFGDKNIGDALGRANRNKLFGGDLVGKNEATPKEISDYFNSVGITGIKYLDAGSRGVKKGTTNFVSFRPETIEILERNGRPTRKELLQQELDKLDK
jgi:hypothetical protein